MADSRAELRGCRLGRASAANVFAVQKNRPVGDRMEKRSAKSERENGNAKNNTAPSDCDEWKEEDG